MWRCRSPPSRCSGSGSRAAGILAGRCTPWLLAGGNRDDAALRGDGGVRPRRLGAPARAVPARGHLHGAAQWRASGSSTATSRFVRWTRSGPHTALGYGASGVVGRVARRRAQPGAGFCCGVLGGVRGRRAGHVITAGVRSLTPGSPAGWPSMAGQPAAGKIGRHNLCQGEVTTMPNLRIRLPGTARVTASLRFPGPRGRPGAGSARPAPPPSWHKKLRFSRVRDRRERHGRAVKPADPRPVRDLRSPGRLEGVARTALSGAPKLSGAPVHLLLGPERHVGPGRPRRRF